MQEKTRKFMKGMRKIFKSVNKEVILEQVKAKEMMACRFDRRNAIAGTGEKVVRRKRDEQPCVMRAQENNMNNVMGLCRDCGNRKAFEKSQVPGGIWYCEEYA
ncbi:MAG: hypothetical protein JW768_16615 [Chitinispirillaceae bacterium]|nr:hypothetical protein [Chitinispirillaceae bacterium]